MDHGYATAAIRVGARCVLRERVRTASLLGMEGVVMRARVRRSFKLALGTRTRANAKSTSVILEILVRVP
jgi:hypothetical protein